MGARPAGYRRYVDDVAISAVDHPWKKQIAESHRRKQIDLAVMNIACDDIYIYGVAGQVEIR